MGSKGSNPPSRSELPKTYLVKGNPKMPNPSKDRTAWMIGQTRDDLAYFAHVCEKGGPGAYEQSPTPIKPQNHRVKFTKETRFNPMTMQYVSKAHNQANLCTEGPGPKYMSNVTQLDLTNPVNPKWRLRASTEFNTQRNSFLQGQIKGGYMYRAIPATGEKLANVNPQTYEPDPIKNSKPKSVQQPFDKNDRFKFAHKQYQNNRMAAVGLNSPGPNLNPENGTLAKSAKKSPATTTPQGKWCP